MKLPNGGKAIIDTRKLIEYSLSDDHEDGKHKAAVFRAVLGLRVEHAALLVDALRKAAANMNADSGKQDKYGQRYTLDFSFNRPAGSAVIRSAWIVRTGEDVPRLITCYIL
jgi:hypothetical protein